MRDWHAANFLDREEGSQPYLRDVNGHSNEFVGQWIMSFRGWLLGLAYHKGIRGALLDDVVDEALTKTLLWIDKRRCVPSNPLGFLSETLRRVIATTKRLPHPTFSDLGLDFAENQIDLAQSEDEESHECRWILRHLGEGLAKKAEDYATGRENRGNVCGRTRQRLRKWHCDYANGPAQAQHAFNELFTYPNGEFHTLGREWEWVAPSETLADYYEKECFGMPKEFVRLHHNFGVFFISSFERLGELGRAPKGIFMTRAKRLINSCSEACWAKGMHAAKNWGFELREDQGGLKWLQDQWGYDTACVAFSGAPEFRRLLYVAIRKTGSLDIRILKPGKAIWEKLAQPIVNFSLSGVQADFAER